MSFTINFADVETVSAIPAGRYPVIVEKVTLKPTAAGDSHYLLWSLQLTDGEFVGRKLSMITSLKPNALWKLKSVLTALGQPTTTIEFNVDESSGLVLSPELTGLSALAIVRIEVYENQERSRVDDLLPVADAATGVTSPSKKSSGPKFR